MLFKVFRCLSLVVSASCFAVPERLADDVYSVYTDKNGTETHKLIRLNPGPHHHHVNANTNTHGLMPSAKFNTRQVPGPYGNNMGYGGYYLDIAGTNSANAALYAQCGDGAYVGLGLNFYPIVGCTLTYFCNFSQALYDVLWFWTSTTCYAYERQAAANAINGPCKEFGAGWDHFTWNGGYDRVGSYGWESISDQGRNFCGRGV